VFFKKFNRDAFVSHRRNCNSVSTSPACITQFRVIERFCAESKIKRSHRGALAVRIYKFLLTVLLEQGFSTFCFPCTPLAFQRMSMYPFSIPTDEQWTCTPKITSYDNIFYHGYSWIYLTISIWFWYMCKYSNINLMQLFFSLILLTSNVPLQIGKYTPGTTCTPGWEPLS